MSCSAIRDISMEENIIGDEEKKFTLMGRMMSKRIMGKSSFANIKDESGKIQFYVDKKNFLMNNLKFLKNLT